jgi:hypothetical protein
MRAGTLRSKQPPGDNLQTTWHMTRAASGMFFGPEPYKPEIVDANPFDRYAIQ